MFNLSCITTLNERRVIKEEIKIEQVDDCSWIISSFQKQAKQHFKWQFKDLKSNKAAHNLVTVKCYKLGRRNIFLENYMLMNLSMKQIEMILNLS